MEGRREEDRSILLLPIFKEGQYGAGDGTACSVDCMDKGWALLGSSVPVSNVQPPALEIEAV